MNIFQLEYFSEVVKTGSITDAAKNLFVTQPAVTKQLQLLEDELNCRLFIRSTRSMELTPLGKTVFERSEEILDSIRSLKEEVNESQGNVVGKVSIGCGAVIGRCKMPEIIQRSLRKYPDINFSILESDSARIYDMLRKKIVDVGICIRPAKTAGIKFETLLNDKIILICSRKSNLAKLNAISPEDLKDVTLIKHHRGNSYKHFLSPFFDRFNDKDDGHALEMMNTETIIPFVQRDLGVTMTSEFLIKLLRPRGIVIKKLAKQVNVEFGLMYDTERYQSIAVKTFIDFIKQTTDIWSDD